MGVGWGPRKGWPSRCVTQPRWAIVCGGGWQAVRAGREVKLSVRARHSHSTVHLSPPLGVRLPPLQQWAAHLAVCRHASLPFPSLPSCPAANISGRCHPCRPPALQQAKAGRRILLLACLPPCVPSCPAALLLSFQCRPCCPPPCPAASQGWAAHPAFYTEPCAPASL